MSQPSEDRSHIESVRSSSGLSQFVSTAGYVLGISYPLLALSTGARAFYQLFFKAGVTNYLGPSLSAVAAAVYVMAAVGFMRREKWAWWMSVCALSFETVMVILVGMLSFVIPEVIGHTAWGHFGADYGFFPFAQPILGLTWLFWPETMRAYRIRK